jgi:hypothetical protein
MSDDILVLPDGNSDASNLEPHDAPKEQASLADTRIARKISHRAHHAGKALLEQCMEEFERYLFMARTGDRARA